MTSLPGGDHDLRERLDQIEDRMRASLTRVQGLEKQMHELIGVPSGAVSVVIGKDGDLARIALDERAAAAMSGEELRHAIRIAVARAAAAHPAFDAAALREALRDGVSVTELLQAVRADDDVQQYREGAVTVTWVRGRIQDVACDAAWLKTVTPSAVEAAVRDAARRAWERAVAAEGGRDG